MIFPRFDGRSPKRLLVKPQNASVTRRHFGSDHREVAHIGSGLEQAID